MWNGGTPWWFKVQGDSLNPHPYIEVDILDIGGGGGIDYRFEIWEKGDLVTARSPSYLSPLKQNEG